MNKIYSVLRLDQWNKAQEVYTGRIRDCKKSLKTIGEEYKKRGWEAKKLRLHINPKVKFFRR